MGDQVTENTKAFGKRVRFLRKLEGKTQAKLAEQAGISLEHLNKLERGAAAPSFKAICQLAHALHTEAANLLLFPDSGNNPGEQGMDWLTHVTGLGAWHIDFVSGTRVMSSGLCGLLGLPPRQVVGEECLVRPHVVPADMPVYERAHELLAKGEDVGPSVLRIQRKDGDTRHVVAMAELLRDAQGGVTGSFGCMVDVTEPHRLERSLRGTQEILEQRVRERTELLDRTIERLNAVIAEKEHTARSLHETEGRERQILDALPLLVAYVDRDERVLFVNERYARYRGGSPADYVGRSVRDVVGEKTYNEISRENLRKAFGGTRVISEVQLEMADGTKPHFYAQWVPALDDQGQVKAMFFWALDISERKFAEEILRRSEERFRAIVENLPDIYWVIEEHGLSYLSPSFERYFGMSPEEAKRDFAAFLERLHPDDREAPRRLMQRGWDENTIFDYSVRVLGDGKVTRFAVRNSPVRDASGRIVQVVGVARPVDG